MSSYIGKTFDFTLVTPSANGKVIAMDVTLRIIEKVRNVYVCEVDCACEYDGAHVSFDEDEIKDYIVI